MLRIPTRNDLEGLLAWHTPAGVVSVYLDLHPEDRGRAWRTELRNGLAAVRDDNRQHRSAVEATAKRIEGRIEAEAEGASGRNWIGFVEVAAKPRKEEWFSVQAALPATKVAIAERPVVAPLAALLDRNDPRGVAAISAERVRLLRWSLGGIEELADRDLEIYSLDWRERKAQRSSDPARVQGASASGHDRHAQRLEANRERFLTESGRIAASELKRRGCADLLAFGDADHVRALAEGVGPDLSVRVLEPINLISEPLEAIAKRVEGSLVGLQREREQRLVERVKSAIDQGERGVVGAAATNRALAQGRVQHLLLDGGASGAERLVEDALATGALITQLNSEAAAATLAATDGVAALLRY